MSTLLKLWIVCMTLVVLPWKAAAGVSDSTLLTKNFKFKDGIYSDFGSFQRNNPVWSWDAVSADRVVSWNKNTLQVAAIRVKEAVTGQDSLDMSNIWGLCVDGVPYIRLPDTLKRNDAWVFAALQVRGRISYYEYEEATTELLTVKAYNPVTGRPFREGQVPREKLVTRKMMLDFASGSRVPFDKDNLLEWIKTDEGLWQAVGEIDPGDAGRLFKSLLIFDDRNPVFLP